MKNEMPPLLRCYFNGKVRPQRNCLQRLFDRLLKRKWVLVASMTQFGEPELYWFEMRR